MSVITSYKELLVWQKSFQLTKDVYKLCNQLPPHERFGLYSQITRAAVSVCSNIAEGWARNSTKDFINFLYMSRGSLAELETQLLLVDEIDSKMNTQTMQDDITEINKMLNAMITKLKERVS